MRRIRKVGWEKSVRPVVLAATTADKTAATIAARAGAPKRSSVKGGLLNNLVNLRLKRGELEPGDQVEVVLMK